MLADFVVPSKSLIFEYFTETTFLFISHRLPALELPVEYSFLLKETTAGVDLKGSMEPLF